MYVSQISECKNDQEIKDKCVHIFCIHIDTYYHKGETITTTYSTKEKMLSTHVHTYSFDSHNHNKVKR
jgi:hypothetical protein